jgi:hypothetical protein
VYGWFNTGRVSKPHLVRFAEITGATFRAILEGPGPPPAAWERGWLALGRKLFPEERAYLVAVATMRLRARGQADGGALPPELEERALQMAIEMQPVTDLDEHANEMPEAHHLRGAVRRSDRGKSDRKGAGHSKRHSPPRAAAAPHRPKRKKAN